MNVAPTSTAPSTSTSSLSIINQFRKSSHLPPNFEWIRQNNPPKSRPTSAIIYSICVNAKKINSRPKKEHILRVGEGGSQPHPNAADLVASSSGASHISFWRESRGALDPGGQNANYILDGAHTRLLLYIIKQSSCPLRNNRSINRTCDC